VLPALSGVEVSVAEVLGVTEKQNATVDANCHSEVAKIIDASATDESLWCGAA
jgi:hypothetical protein